MKRVDGNHASIVKGLRAVGATVRSTAMVGQGFPDILCAYRGVNYLFEIKDGAKSPSKRQLTAAEEVFHETWRGQVAIVTSLDEALAAIGAVI